jgi:hypothetical protein
MVTSYKHREIAIGAEKKNDNTKSQRKIPFNFDEKKNDIIYKK